MKIRLVLQYWLDALSHVDTETTNVGGRTKAQTTMVQSQKILFLFTLPYDLYENVKVFLVLYVPWITCSPLPVPQMLFSTFKTVCALPHINALCVKPLRNLGIQGFAKMNPSTPIFPTQNYFRWKYLRTTFVSVSLSFKYLVRVENIQLN